MVMYCYNCGSEMIAEEEIRSSNNEINGHKWACPDCMTDYQTIELGDEIVDIVPLPR